MKKFMVDLEPKGTAGNPIEIAEAVVGLCSEAASFGASHALSADGEFVLQ